MIRFVSRILLLLPLVACGPGFEADKNANKRFDCTNSSCNELFEVKPDKQESIVSHRQIIPSYSSCLGLAESEVSARTKTTVSSLKETLSKNGDINGISAPMMMGLITVVGDFCTDLMDKEKSSSVRKYFLGFNLGGTANGQNYDASQTVQTLAQSCWGRAARTDEINIVNSAMQKAGLSTTKDRKAALFLCTTVLSSSDAVRF